MAEISELNPNVMMEVGGILISDDTRPVVPKVLYWETRLLNDQGDNHTAILRMQEAIACQRVDYLLSVNGTTVRGTTNPGTLERGC